MRFAAVTECLAGLGSDKWALSQAATARDAAGLPVINLTIGEPDTLTPPVLIDAACDALKAGRTGYSNGRGEVALLEALSRRYTHRLGRPVTPQRFLCLPGTQTALFLALQATCDPGDEVIVGDPMYATYEGLIRAAGAFPVRVRLLAENGFRLRPEDVAAAITPATRVIFINTPHNPTGAILRRDDLHGLGTLAAAHDLWLLSDEVYGDLTHAGRPFPSALADSAFEERTLVAASISKSHAAPGFRSGWLVGSEDFCARALPLSETMLFGSQPFVADMTAQALNEPPSLAQGMARRMARRVLIVEDALNGVAGIKVQRPEAGMFALVDIHALTHDSRGFALAMLDATGVAVMPGASFGPALEGWLRLALNASDDDTALACTRIAAFAREWAA